MFDVLQKPHLERVRGLQEGLPMFTFPCPTGGMANRDHLIVEYLKQKSKFNYSTAEISILSYFILV